MIYKACGESEDHRGAAGLEDKESWALEGRLLHLLAACLGPPVFCLWPWAGCQGTEPCLRHMKP